MFGMTLKGPVKTFGSYMVKKLKLCIITIVWLLIMLDVYIITQGSTVRTAVIMFYAANDGISILENLTELGLPVPEKVRKILEQLKEGEDEQ